MELDTAFERLRRIRNEYEAVRFALGKTLGALQVDAEVLKQSISQNLPAGEFERARRNIEKTYIIRLFSEFEGIAIHYYRYGLRRRGLNPKIAPVMAVLENRRNMDPATGVGAADVRTTRNNIIHRGENIPPLDFHDCKRRLGRFLSWLPQTWPDF